MEHWPGKAFSLGSMPSDTLLSLSQCVFEEGTLLALLQSTQLYDGDQALAGDHTIVYNMIAFVTWPPFSYQTYYKGGQMTKSIILVKICYKLLYVI